MKLGQNSSNIFKSAPRNIGVASQPSFKGFIPQKLVNVFNNLPCRYNITNEAFETIDNIVDGRLVKYIKRATELASESGLSHKFKVENGEFIFEDQSFFKKFAGQITHPFKNAWLDMANGLVDKFGYTKFAQRSSIFKSLRESDVLIKRRKFVEARGVFDTIHGILDMAVNTKPSNGERGLINGINPQGISKAYFEVFNGKKGNYSTESERAFNKIACGLVSGTFAAKDFYNITRYHSDNDAEAKKAQKKRLKQEVLRSGINAALIYTGMGAIAKYANNNKWVAIGSLMGTTLIAELGSRLINKTPIMPLSVEKAKKLHEKKYGKRQATAITPQMNDLHNFVKSPDAIEKFKAGSIPGDLNPKTKVNFSGAQKPQEAEKTKGSALLKNIIKGFGALFAAGVMVGLGRNASKSFDTFAKGISDAIKGVYKKAIIGVENVPEEKMAELVEKLKKTCGDDLADSCQEALSKLKLNERSGGGKFYTLKRAHGSMKPLIDILLFPVEFILKAPKLGQKLVNRIIKGGGASSAAYEAPVATEKLLMMYRKLGKKTKLPDIEFRKCVDNLFQTTFSISNSGFDNKKLIGDFLFFNTLIPSIFFVNDFRNHELVESNGEDKEGIASTTKNKVGHRFVNFFSNKLFISLFTTLFGGVFNGSLVGATAVSAATEFSNETTIRKLIGVPTKKMSKQEIEDFESKNYYSSGWKGKYMRFISSLTGKKPLGEKVKAEKEKAAKTR